jgi:RNA polymerase sigma-70 factor (ECF subfamily)
MRSSGLDIACRVSVSSKREGLRLTEPFMDDADTALTAATRLDGAESVAQLVERYGGRMYQLALRITDAQEDAEEIVEHTLRMAAGTIDSFTDESAFESWIYRTVAQTAYQRCKRRLYVDERTLDDTVPALAGDGRHFAAMQDWSMRIDDPSLQDGLRDRLSEAIAALPADYRTALVLHDVEGVSKPHIAEILGIDVPAVSSRVHRARLFARKRLSEYFEAGE